MNLTNDELKSVNGGIAKWGIIGLVGAGLVVFAIGFADGFTRTLKCNK